MNMAMKGALLNALLFPGWGEIYLKKYGRGILIISGMIAGILSILLLVVQETMTVLKSTPFDKTTLSPATLLQLSLQVIRSLNLSGLLIILLFMIILWIISIIDAYRLGREAMAKLNTDADQ